MKNAATKIFSTVLLMAAMSFSAKAQDAVTAPQIRYIGLVNNQMVFQVAVQNESRTPFKLEVADNNGFQFYTSTHNETSFQKRFAIAKEEAENTTLVFIITSGNKEVRQSFDITPLASAVRAEGRR